MSWGSNDELAVREPLSQIFVDDAAVSMERCLQQQLVEQVEPAAFTG
ncbi:hypothetical protein [Paenibacillus ginsengarvi]|nr:hypothetical protein [Paenibacillus ginsengarvi]